jgi:methylmalonyl-CoA/ethylmalonyl-CoA epimerase
MPPELVFHHLGVACHDLDGEEKVLAALGYQREGPDFEDPIQGIRGRFLIGPGPRLELLVALPGAGVLDPWLQKGVKIYHHAFEVADMTAGLAALEAARGKRMGAVVPAVAFGGRKICFVMMPNMMLFELIERPTR